MDASETPKKAPSSRLTLLLRFVVLVGILNFAAYLLVARAIGGNAYSGKIEKKRYYVADHGVFTQVTRGVYVASYVHTISVFVSHPAAIAAGIALVWRAKRNR